MDNHQQTQIEIINALETQISTHSLSSTTISPITDFDTDQRMTLTAVHLPTPALISSIQNELINPLQKLFSKAYYYPVDTLHLTIKNVRTPHDPPLFSKDDVLKAEQVFAGVIPKHSKFNVYFYRLLLYPNSLALIGTTDAELDRIIFDLDAALAKQGITDDKKYVNTSHFFINMTFARFADFSADFENKVKELSSKIKFPPYQVTDVSLVTSNSVLKMLNIINTWDLR